MENQTLYEKILSKPKSYRRRLSYVITAIIGIFIFTIWIIMTTLSMKEVFNFEDTESENTESSFSEGFDAPSLYEEEDMQLMKENFDNLMQQQEEQNPSIEEKNIDL